MFSFIKLPYVYVEPCPECGSRCTGRYVKEPMTQEDMDYIELQSLKHGEIVRFMYAKPQKNAFCVDCGYTWETNIRTIFVSKQRITEEIEARGTREAYMELKNEIAEKKGTGKGGFFRL
jgi:hypothetical protein